MNFKTKAILFSGLLLTITTPAFSEQEFDNQLTFKVKKDSASGICPDIKILRKIEQYDGGAKFSNSGEKFKEFANNFTLKSKDKRKAIWEATLVPKYSKCSGNSTHEEAQEIQFKFKGGKVNFTVNMDSNSEIFIADNKNKMPFFVWETSD
jgi:hypothetical protein